MKGYTIQESVISPEGQAIIAVDVEKYTSNVNALVLADVVADILVDIVQV